MCLAANTVRMPGNYAIVIAEIESPRHRLVQSLAKSGITDFDQTILFEDYTPDELLEILQCHLLKYELQFDTFSEAILRKYINNLCAGGRTDYANARTMKLIARSIQKLVLLAKNDSGIITASNIAEFASTQPPASGRVGYR